MIANPLLSVTLTVYDPGTDATIDCVVSPVGDHKYARPGLALSVTLPPEQKESGPLEVIVEGVPSLV